MPLSVPPFADLLRDCDRSAVHLELRDIRWEHYVTRELTEAGEQVRWLPRRRTTDLSLPGNDFWLFDGRLARIHHFDGDGAVVDDELSDDPRLIRHLATAFEAVWHRAVPHAQFRV